MLLKRIEEMGATASILLSVSVKGSSIRDDKEAEQALVRRRCIEEINWGWKVQSQTALKKRDNKEEGYNAKYKKLKMHGIQEEMKWQK